MLSELVLEEELVHHVNHLLHNRVLSHIIVTLDELFASDTIRTENEGDLG